jgi:predicted phage terminase large subunit-like protein
VIRDRTWDALQDDLMSRLEPGGALVLMATRWHQDDPTGRMLRMIEDKAKCNGPVVRLRLPALAEPNDVLGRNEGDPLWSARYPKHILEAIRERSGPYSWSALYQQRPTPSEGGIFKRAWFKPIATIPTPHLEIVARYWDLAMSSKTSADYTVGVKMARDVGGHLYVLDVTRAHLEWGDVTDYMADVIMADGPMVAQGVEEAGYMSRAVQDLTADPRLHNYAIWGYPVERDKLTRALPFAARAAAGHVSVLESHWTPAYLDELCAFDRGAHDDQVDASSGAYEMLGAAGAGDAVIIEDDNDWFEGAY